MKKLNTKNVIDKCIKVHGNKFDYTLVDYVNATTPIRVLCKKHDEFTVLVHNHIKYSTGGCKQCQIESNTKSTNDFIIEANKIHENKYDYSKTKYIRNDAHVIITCPIHGDFSVKPIYHTKKQNGCSKCSSSSSEQKLKKFITKAHEKHKNKYNYSQAKYVNHNLIENIMCPVHGLFNQSPSTHLRSGGCIKCGVQTKTKSNVQFIQDAIAIHKDKYDYSKTKYIRNDVPVTITCKNGHTFEQKPTHHLTGSGCPSCSKTTSKAENEIVDYITSIIDTPIITNSHQVIPPLEIDIYIPQFNLAIEFCGLYWHHTDRPHITPSYHAKKQRKCKKQEIQLITIFDHEWNNSIKRSIIKSIIRNKLHLSNKIYARKCTIDIINSSEYKQFLNANHIQGHRPASIKIGLRYNDELVQVVSLGKSRFTKSHEFEIIRIATKLNFHVVGGVSKLFKYILSVFSINSIVSYADLRFGDGNVYSTLNFTLTHTSSPNYWYTSDFKTLHSRLSFQKHKLIKNGLNSQLTEKQIMQSGGYYRIYDCGNNKWEWIRNN